MSLAETQNLVRQKAMRGLKLASAATAGKTVLDALTNLALARLLMPESFGIFAAAQALTGFVSCLTDYSGLKFLIRKKNLTRRDVSSVFWLELAAGVVVALAWYLLAGPVLRALNPIETAADAARLAQSIDIAQVLAFWIIAERLMLPRALHDHALRFGPVNLGLFMGVAAGSVSSLVVAFFAGGAWPFVTMLIVRTIVAAAWMWRAAGFLPSLRFDPRILKDLLPFGAPLMATTAITFAYTNIDYLIVGSMLDEALLGVYYAAYRYPHYLIQFNMIINSVIFPAFSRATDPEHIARGLKYVTRYAGALAVPVMIAVWAEGDTLVIWLLGDAEKWAGVVFPFQVFTTLAGLRLTFTHWGHIFVVQGNTKPLLYAALFNLPAISVACWIGVRLGGINGAAIGVAAVSFGTIAFCCFVLLKRVLEYSYLRALWPVLVAGGAMLVALAILKLALPSPDMWAVFARLAVAGTVYSGVFLALCGAEMLRLVRNRG